MTALIRHFGDTADAHRPCGRCDFCSPATASAQSFARPTSRQARDLRAILSALGHAPSRATGKLHTELALGIERREFDGLLDALARAGLITLTSETFTNAEGKVLPYKKAALTHEGRSDDANELAGVVLPAGAESEASSARSRSRRGSSSASRKAATDAAAPLTGEQQQLDDALRAWRKAEAAKTGKPAFIVLSDAVLRNIAAAHPRTLAELLTVAGIGPNKAETHGAAILAVCRGDNSAAVRPSISADRPSKRPAPGVAKAAPSLPFAPVPTVASPPATLTADQQQLDDRLRAWRKAESEKMGLPQFFVLGASTLRSIVLERPRTVAELQAIQGIGAEKAAKFGASIVELCNA
jgi:ATP-dependent DNA helicase RecQ